MKIKVKRLKVIAGADFSAQEPRVMSSLCGERELIDGYNLRTKEFPKGKDFYAMLASSAYGKDYWECTEFDQNGKFNQEGKNRRQDGKVIQLGVSYGMGTKLLVENLNKKKKPGEEKMTIEQGQAMMESFFGKFASLRAWKDYNMARLEQFGYMETALGRRRRLYDTWLPDYEIKALSIEPIEDIFFNMDLKVKLVEGTELSKFPASILVEDGTRTKEIVNRLNSISNPFKKKDLIADLEKDPLNRIKSNGGFKSRPKTQATNFCISGDTRVITPEGVKWVKDLPGKVEVWDGEKFTTGTVVKTGFRPHYRVVFEDGNYVDCSPEHPFCKISCGTGNVVWKEASKLKPKDMIRLSGEAEFYNSLEPFSGGEFSGKEAYNRKEISFNQLLDHPYELGILLGRMASDGSFSPGGKGYTIKWVVAEHEYSILPELEKCFGNLKFIKRVSDRSKKGRKEIVNLKICSKSLKQELIQMGIKNHIPENLWANKEALRGFLRGMFDGDGGVNLNKSGKGNLNLVFGKGDFSRYARDIKLALGCFGILSRINTLSHRTNITIMKRDIGKFIDRIGFMNPEKNERAKKLFSSLTKTNSYGDTSRVKEVIELGEEIEMYDIVNTGSGYFVGNSLVLHNCVQGGSAELTKRAMVAIYNHPDKERLGIGILAPVHDEILIEGYAEYREEVLKTLSSCMSNSAVGIYEVNMICDGVVESQWNLGHFCDKIQKEFKKLTGGDSPLTKEQALEKIYDNYPEISEESLKSIVEGTLDVELDRLKVRKL